MDNRLIPGSAGEVLLYQDSRMSEAMMRLTVTLTMGIRKPVLEQAVRDLMPRFSQLSARMERVGDDLVLFRNSGEVPVLDEGDLQAEGSDMAGSPALGGHMFRLTVSHKTLHIDWHMSICDERGMSEFAKSLVFRYIQLCGFPVGNDGSINEPDDPTGTVEGIDPYDRLEDIPASRPVWYMDAKAFSAASPEDASPDGYGLQIRIPLSRVKGNLRQYLQQPEAFISPLFSHAIYERHEGEIAQGEYIVSRIRENLRPHFPTASFRTFYSPVTLAYNRKVTEYPFNTILMSQKKLLDAQLRHDALAYSALRLVRSKESVCDTGMQFDRKTDAGKALAAETAHSATFSICNMGNPVIPESLQQYIVEFYPVVTSSVFAYALSVICFKGDIVINVSCRDRDRTVPFRFVELLNGQGMYAFVSDEYTYGKLKYMPK